MSHSIFTASALAHFHGVWSRFLKGDSCVSQWTPDETPQNFSFTREDILRQIEPLSQFLLKMWMTSTVVPVFKAVGQLLRNRNEDPDLIRRVEQYIKKKLAKELISTCVSVFVFYFFVSWPHHSL